MGRRALGRDTRRCMYMMKLVVISIVHNRLNSKPRARARARGASGRARALDDDDVDVVVRPLQQQLPRERQLSSLLRRSQRPVQRLERVRHLIVAHERAELHLRRAIARHRAVSRARRKESFRARASRRSSSRAPCTSRPRRRRRVVARRRRGRRLHRPRP